MANILHDSIVQIPWMCVRLCTWESKRSHMVRAMAITIARTRGRQKIKKSRRRILKTWSRWSTKNCQNAYISLCKRLFCPDCRSCGFWDQWHMIRVNKNGWPHLVQQSDTIILPHLCHRGKVQWHIFLGNSAKPLAVAFQNIYLPTVPWAHHHLLIGTIVKILNIFLFFPGCFGWHSRFKTKIRWSQF